MGEIRKADPAARRRAVVVILLGVLAGALLIGGFEHYRPLLLEWLLSQPGELANRARLVFLLSAAVLSAPLIASAVHLWLLGARVVRAQECPPPGYRVIRDTPVVDGHGAVLLGRGLKVLALCLCAASLLLWWSLWRLAWLLGDGAA